MEYLPRRLKALADETRFRIVNLLLTHDYCVGALARRLGISEAAVSQHLQILRKTGLIKGEKRGYWTHYSVERDVLRQIANDLQSMAAQPVQYEYVCRRESTTRKGTVEGREEAVCICECKCERPEKLKGKPGECSPEQIEECHGDKKDHPCGHEEK
ncbi:MAG: winged helix-turn-helix transcriptional regulator [Firmicutes bacterium]|nr:winged helix-turn-helix transcriptional regulator [Bacillota bacterium]